MGKLEAAKEALHNGPAWLGAWLSTARDLFGLGELSVRRKVPPGRCFGSYAPDLRNDRGSLCRGPSVAQVQ